MKLLRIIAFVCLVAYGGEAYAQNNGALLPALPQQFLTANGTPASNGRLCTQASGTNTPLAVYSDPALTLPLPNPIKLNAAGIATSAGGTQAAVYTQASAYRVTLYASGAAGGNICNGTAVGALIWQFDGVYDFAQVSTGGGGSGGAGGNNQSCKAGTTLSDKITAAYALLPASGGIIDCTNLNGAQSIIADPFTGMTSSVTVIMPVGTATSTVALNIPKNVALLFPKGAILSNNNPTVFKSLIDAGLNQIFAGSGAVTLRDGTPSAYPEWWGAKGDGVTDDSAAFQSAFNAGFATGAVVRLAASPYKIASTVTMPQGTNSVLSVQGSPQFHYGGTVAGKTYGTRILCTMTGSDCWSGTGTAAQNPTYIFANFAMAGPDLQGFTTSGNGIKFSFSGSAVPIVYMENLDIEMFQGANTAAITLSNVEDGSLKDVNISFVNKCAELNTSYNANSWYNVSCSLALNDGVHLSGPSQSFSMFGGLFQSNVKTGLHLDGTVGVTLSGVHFENNNTSNTAGEGAIKMTSLAATYGNFNTMISGCSFNSARDKIFTSGGDSTWNNSFLTFISNYVAVVSNPVITLGGGSDQGWTIIDSAMGTANISDTLGQTQFIDRGLMRQGSYPFSNYPTCDAAHAGFQGNVTDSTTTTFGATVTGSGTNNVQMRCNGTHWTVMGI